MYSIHVYVRYRDDFLVGTTASADDARELFDKLREKSHPFKVKVESVSKHFFVMLDLHVWKGPRFHSRGILDFKMHFKSTHQAVSLDCRSHHPVTIHALWPVERFNSFSLRCSDSKAARSAKLEFLEKFCRSQPSHTCIPSLVEMLGGRGDRVQGRKPDRGSWLVLPFHSTLLSSGLGANLYDLSSMFERYGLERFAPKLSWKLVDPSLFQLLARDLNTKLSTISSDQPGSGG